MPAASWSKKVRASSWGRGKFCVELMLGNIALTISGARMEWQRLAIAPVSFASDPIELFYRMTTSSRRGSWEPSFSRIWWYTHFRTSVLVTISRSPCFVLWQLIATSLKSLSMKVYPNSVILPWRSNTSVSPQGLVSIAVDKASTTADENCVDCPTE
jgi:hypothetical protein